ncbi:MAG: hypothetical protein IJC45_06800 [Clostridia bacterium]|nr:hypothetical protein [Clostridia bacterium]
MAFIRSREEERTGYQNGLPLEPFIDFQNDFVMCYRLNETTSKRVQEYRENGYVVHLMTGISWGAYQDYLLGEYDGREHRDEWQKDRYGNEIVHGEMTPYMVPTISFADYLSEKLKIAVDAGVVAIHVEEPEFWDRGGYSDAFKREYELYYREPWQAPHNSVDAHYRCAQLKAYLYRRTIDRVSSSIKEYAKVRYGRDVRFYVPTHSLLNYTQWKIMSPEGMLADIPGVDGFIAQVWTGTSREKNVYNAVFKERTFETAYLEYGVMQELVRGTGKRMWFLHDPIEDNPIFDWNDYRENYYKTVTASLLHPHINHYEICPWPDRIMHGAYPKGAPDAITIPDTYRTLLNGMFQTLGDIECAENRDALRVGVLMSDTALYQRTFPDHLYGKAPEEEVGTVLRTDETLMKSVIERVKNGTSSREDELKIIESNAFPLFYGLSLPLLNNGLPVRPVLLDNVRRYHDTLDEYNLLVCSFEFMKPLSPDVNNALAAWVQKGGVLIYVGDGSDPFHAIRSWWTGKYDTPAQHLFELFGLERTPNDGTYRYGKGHLIVHKRNPMMLCVRKDLAEEYKQIVKNACVLLGTEWQADNKLLVRRGNHVIVAALGESDVAKPVEMHGLFADMYTENFEIKEHIALAPDTSKLLFDFDTIAEEDLRIIGTCVRVFSMQEENGKIVLSVRGAQGLKAFMRLRVPADYASAKATIDGEAIECEYDEKSRTVLLTFDSVTGDRSIEIIK